MSVFLCGLLSFVLTFFFTEIWLGCSRKLSAYQIVREEGPRNHLATKSRVPTMGGSAILLAVTLALGASPLWSPRLVAPLGAFLASGLLGLLDDGLKVWRGRNLGLKARHKVLGQVLIGVGLWLALERVGAPHRFVIPLLGNWDSGRLYPFLVILVFMATTNAVNLTDGLDGLASGICASVASFFLALAYFSAPHPAEAYFSAALVGTLLGFLWFNAYPARVFMGDSGSLALGGGLAALALQTGLVFWLPLAGGVLVAETLSVIIQVAYFKLTGGKRIFKMSPLHHHFELSGIPETQVTVRFWIVSVFLCCVSIVGAMRGY